MPLRPHKYCKAQTRGCKKFYSNDSEAVTWCIKRIAWRDCSRKLRWRWPIRLIFAQERTTWIQQSQVRRQYAGHMQCIWCLLFIPISLIFLSLSESTSLTVSSVKRASNAKFFTVCRVCKLLIKCQRYHQGDCHPDAVVGCLLWVSTRHCLASCRSLVLWRYLKSYWFSNTEIWWVITDDSSGWLKWQAKCFTLRAMLADRANAIKAVCRDLREEREHLKANSKTPICMIQFVS